MKTIRLDCVIIPPNRQRREFNETSLQSLSHSIETFGLQNAIVLRNDAVTLVSGERRLRAATDLYDLGGIFLYDGEIVKPGHIPFVTISDLDAIAREEAELEENVRRDNLTWQEEATAVARIKRLRDAQRQKDRGSDATVAEIALEVRGSDEPTHHEATRRQLLVARKLDNPAIKGAKSVNEAFKILKREEEKERNVAYAQVIGRESVSSKYALHNADALEWLAACPEGQFDVILTDPPYGMGADEFGDAGGKSSGSHAYEDSESNLESILIGCVFNFTRITKEQAHLYWFCDIDKFQGIRETFASAGWWVFRTPFIWHKPGAPRAPWPEHGPQRQWECILYAVKGKKPCYRLGSDVLTYKSDENLGHAAQKPVNLFVDLLSRSVRPGDSVLDPFAGTGTIFAAAHEMNCRATGVEMDESAYGIAAKRIEGLGE